MTKSAFLQKPNFIIVKLVKNGTHCISSSSVWVSRLIYLFRIDVGLCDLVGLVDNIFCSFLFVSFSCNLIIACCLAYRILKTFLVRLYAHSASAQPTATEQLSHLLPLIFSARNLYPKKTRANNWKSMSIPPKMKRRNERKDGGEEGRMDTGQIFS